MARKMCWLVGMAFVWLSVLHRAAPVLGQTPASAKEDPLVLRVATRLVQVNVIVQDKKGEPVTNLTRDDFVLLENGYDKISQTKRLSTG